MKKNEKNFMWAAIAVLAVLQLWPVVAPDKKAKGGPDTKRQWMSQMREHRGSWGDAERGERTRPRVRGEHSRGERTPQ
jgi:membrane protein implicated in regulation of membrane protease activity